METELIKTINMKVHNSLKELLEDFSQFINPEIEFIPKNELDEMLSTFLSSNSLALGKPEPLVKNKQFERVCEYCNGWEVDELGDDCEYCDGTGRRD